MQLIVGAGAIGSATARRLAEAGETVRIVTRSGTGPEHPSIERVAVDATDAFRLSRLAAGASAIYNCANPPYHAWPTDWPPLAASMLTAAQTSGASLVITGNLYGYGPVDRPMTEDMPLAASTRKGRVRVKMWHDALDAYRAGRIKAVTEVRAADYIGLKYTLLEMALPALRAGRTFWAPTPLDNPHTFTYTEDVARTLVTLGRDERAWGRAWHVPSPPPMTVRDIVTRTARIAGLPAPKLRAIPEPLIRTVGRYDKWVREFVEMSYQWKRPFVLDATHTSAVFGLSATDADEAIHATLAGAPAAVPS
jgi:nucleoside-diphosphate-sugar epimerase